MARLVAFMFEMHQPRRTRPLSPRSLLERTRGGPAASYDGLLDGQVFRRVSGKCYLPASRILASAAARGFRFSFSPSGVWMEQAAEHAPEVLRELRTAVDAGAEPVAQPYYHGVSPLLGDLDEMEEQVRSQADAVESGLGRRPGAAEATEMLYNDDIGMALSRAGFGVALTEGADRILGWRSPNYLYSSRSGPALLLRNYRLSDDVAFRFSNTAWDQYPLTADKYASWIAASPGDIVFVAMDFETFGEHHWRETGILEFLEALPRELEGAGVEAVGVSEAARRLSPVGRIDVPPWNTISWADVEKDATAWAGSDEQSRALMLYEEAGSYARAVGGELLVHWRYLGMSDNFYYMSVKRGPSGVVHEYFSPYKDPLGAYTSYLHSLLSLYADVLRAYSSGIDVAAWRLRTPHRLSFIARTPGGDVELRDLEDLHGCISGCKSAMAEHLARGDVQSWVRHVVLWDRLADELEEASRAPDPARAALMVLRRHRPGPGSPPTP
ncbi:MAG: glycoside hydrolase family 57 protein [Nitrososphaeria archaeon]